MSAHHPSEDLLLRYGAGTLSESASVLVATHLALCPGCRRAVCHAEAVGGALIEELAPAALKSTAVADAMARLEKAPRDEGPCGRASHSGVLLPRPLCEYLPAPLDDLRWRWRGRGVGYVPLLADRGGRLGLLRIAPGAAIPHHGHSDEELTLVLAGGYRDEGGHYVRGEVQSADAGTLHGPVANPGEPCLCLVMTRGAVKPTHLLARCLAPLLRF